MRIYLLLITILALAMLEIGCAGPAPGARTPQPYPIITGSATPAVSPIAPGAQPYPVLKPTQDAKALLDERCIQCHDLSRVYAARKDKAGWEATIAGMREKGARLTDPEAKALADFLAATYK